MDHFVFQEFEGVIYELVTAIQISRSSGIQDGDIAQIFENLRRHMPTPELAWELRRGIALKRGVGWVRQYWGPEAVVRYFGPWWFRLGNSFRRIPKLWGG